MKFPKSINIVSAFICDISKETSCQPMLLQDKSSFWPRQTLGLLQMRGLDFSLISGIQNSNMILDLIQAYACLFRSNYLSYT